MSSELLKDDGNESFENGVDRISAEISSIQKAREPRLEVFIINILPSGSIFDRVNIYKALICLFPALRPACRRLAALKATVEV